MKQLLQRIKHWLYVRRVKKLLPWYCWLMIQEHGENKTRQYVSDNGVPHPPVEYREAIYDDYRWHYRVSRTEYGFTELKVCKRGQHENWQAVAEYRSDPGHNTIQSQTIWYRLNLGEWTDDFLNSGRLIDIGLKLKAEREQRDRFAPYESREA